MLANFLAPASSMLVMFGALAGLTSCTGEDLPSSRMREADMSASQDMPARMEVVCEDAKIDPLTLQAFSGCTRYKGSLSIADAFKDESYLEPVQELRVIEGELNLFRNLKFNNVDSFKKLERVDGLFKLKSNFELQNFEGFSSLQKVGGLFQVEGSEKVTSLAGFGNLKSVGGMFLFNMPGLISLKGFESLERVDGDLTISLSNVPQEEIDAFVARLKVSGTVNTK